MTTPKKITPSPIIEAVAEVRFENDLPSAVLFGKLYEKLSVQFPKTDQLPILEMPIELLEKQPELRYAPHFRLRNDRFIVNIGQRVITVNRLCTAIPYDNWGEYFECISSVFAAVKAIESVSHLERVSIRYINFFEETVQTVLNLKLDLFKETISDYKQLSLSLERDLDEGIKLNFSLASNAKVDLGGVIQEGLVINIDTFKDEGTPIDDVVGTIESLHTCVEKQFFASINPTFLEGLSPEYEQ